jgi:ATP/ADP translocase
MNKIVIIFFFSIIFSPVYAYLGPGMSGGLITAIIGIIASIILALFGIIYYPIKRFIKSRKKK